MLKAFLAGFGIPNTCNISKNQTICFNNTNIAKIPPLLLEAVVKSDRKPTIIKILIDHDTGKTCFEAQYNIRKLVK